MNTLDVVMGTLTKNGYEISFDYKNFMPDIAIMLSKDNKSVIRRLHHSSLSDEVLIIHEIEKMLEEF